MSFRVFEVSSLAVLALVACAPARGQDITQIVKQQSDGTVRLIFASKPNVCGDGQTFISIRDDDDTNGEHTYYRVGSSRVDLQACKLEYSIVSPK